MLDRGGDGGAGLLERDGVACRPAENEGAPSEARKETASRPASDGSIPSCSKRAASPASQLSKTSADGTCTSAGGLHRTARIPTALMYGRNATYHVARTHARTLIPQVLELMREGKLHPDQVTTDMASLDEASRAIKRHVLGEATKTVLIE